MTIEEIEAAWYMAESPGPDCSDSEWAQRYAWKLLAVAKAASPLREKTSYNKDSWTHVDELRQALEELEKA